MRILFSLFLFDSLHFPPARTSSLFLPFVADSWILFNLHGLPGSSSIFPEAAWYSASAFSSTQFSLVIPHPQALPGSAPACGYSGTIPAAAVPSVSGNPVPPMTKPTCKIISKAVIAINSPVSSLPVSLGSAPPVFCSAEGGDGKWLGYM